MDDPKIDEWLPEHAAETLREVDMARGLCKPFDMDSYREGHLTPVFFGSAINNFGVRAVLQGLARFAPITPQPTVPGRSRRKKSHRLCF